MGRLLAMAVSRRVRRTITHIETGSVLRFALLFWASLVIVGVLAAVILWAAAASVGAIDNVEDLMRELGFEEFRFLPGQMLRGLLGGALLTVLIGSFVTVLMATVYNLIAELVGGLRVIVIEDEVPTEQKRGKGPKAGTRIKAATPRSTPSPQEAEASSEHIDETAWTSAITSTR